MSIDAVVLKTKQNMKRLEKSLDEKKQQQAISNDGSSWIQKEMRLVTKYKLCRKTKM